MSDREAESPASLSTGDWALADQDSDRFAGVLFWRGDRSLVRGAIGVFVSVR
ncbi:hypothetical protein [Halomicronema sp. CCY15110]|uniref:hypothetical protein n=1 Tax=Halomicronema sp. CCY15110 TaxID=2767773 RepID=UPI001951FE19|nr:hypothetical protein [Halomicronema sp. CCY15110]